ncbi:MAG: hypothetical protein M3512_05515 [Bacteroidota bacterium]|nr:hypothetical protein [Bacteroidota bacterium]
MKIPSLTRMPQYKRFNITPRYYDPIKEDIDNRTERIKNEMSLANRTAEIRSGLQKDFLRQERASRKATVTQLLIIVLLIGTGAGWLMYGNNVFYYFLIFVPFYIFFRKSSFFRPK